MLDNFFVKGWIIGFAIAMPVGPIAVLCIQYALMRGRAYGLAAGLGAALADTLYGVLAAFGISLIVHLLNHHQVWFQLIGAILLCYIGIATLNSKPIDDKHQNPVSQSLIRVFATTFFLTLTNPLTFLAFTAIYAGLSINLEEEAILSILLLTGGIFIGSAMWWSLLSFVTAKIGKRIKYKQTYLLTKVSGTVILVCGFLASLDVVQQFIL
jgi:threonine/homoserine/homoserine lactone efflux protein